MANDKPQVHSGYSPQQTLDCERLLVTLLSRLGPYREHLRLVGGLCPRYLCPAAPPNVPEHVGTQDVDLVVNVLVLHNPEAYATLAQNMHRMGFQKALSKATGKPVSWQWERRIEDRGTLLVEFLRDAGNAKPATVDAIKDTGITALAIPHAGMALTWFNSIDVTADLLDAGGKRTETVRHADIVAFTCLKVLAFDDRSERKDAADLAHVLRYYRPNPAETVAAFKTRLAEGTHTEVVLRCMQLLRKHFATTSEAAGWEKSGPVAAATFWYGEDSEARDERVRRQRDVAGTIENFLTLLDKA